MPEPREKLEFAPARKPETEAEEKEKEKEKEQKARTDEKIEIQEKAAGHKETNQEMLVLEKQYDPYKGKTAAEIRFEKAKKERLATVIAQKLKKTHRERIDEYNKKLAKLPEHFDIPRVGPG